MTGAAGTQTVVADANGQYRFQALTPGVYALKATLDGFKTILMEGLRVEVGRTFDVDLRLEVGAMAETVTVTGESPLIDTSQSVGHRQLQPGADSGTRRSCASRSSTTSR